MGSAGLWFLKVISCRRIDNLAHERSGTEAVTFVPSTINLSYQVLSGFSQAANIDVAIVKCNVRARSLQYSYASPIIKF